MKLECASATFAGVGRADEDNEDGLWIAEDHRGCALFDGLSGATGSGRFATALAIESLQRAPGERPAALDDHARASLQRASAHIAAAQGRWPYGSGFGCSATLLVIDEHELALSWAGDVLALLVRDEPARRLTRSHDLPWLFEHDQQWSMLAQRSSLPRNVLCSILGTSNVVIESALELLRRDDRVLLCTASVQELLSDEQLASIVRAERAAQSAADAIIARVIERRCALNATALVARVCGD